MKQKVQRQRQKKEPLGEAKKPREVRSNQLLDGMTFAV